MNLLQKSLSAFGAAAMLAFSSGASAAPVSFNISGAQFVLPQNTGYGIDRDETPSGNLLDVRFSTNSFTTQVFTLNTIGQTFLFTFGTIDFQEPSAGGGIDAGETDNLGISAKLTFNAPSGVLPSATQTVTVTGVATTGSVTDLAVDYVINWSPVTIQFGNGGAFELKLNAMSFDDRGSQDQTVTIKLLHLEEQGLPANGDIPEPASLALLGIGIGCVAMARRRRAKA